MRALVLLISVLLAIGVLYWQAPDVVPAPIRGAIEKAQDAVAGVLARPTPAVPATFSPDQPVWPDALDKPVHKRIPMAVLLGAAGGMLAVLLAGGLWLFRRRRAQESSKEAPVWLVAARQLAYSTADKSSRLAECDLIERKLLSDMRERGEAALARAHQLDLYWRYVGRTNLASNSFIRGPELDRWRIVAKQTLDAVALAPASRSLTIYRQMQPNMWALDAGDARELKSYYDELAKLFAEHDRAWTKASGAVNKPILDKAGLLDAMESLRQVNRMIAKRTAALVGDIEISVRAAS